MQTSFLQTNGVRLHTIQAGDPAHPLAILLHGFPESHHCWRHQIEPLVSAGYFVIVPDQRGYNLSDKPANVSDYDMTFLVADILGLIDHFERDQAVIVSHDWGAAVAWSLAILYPERVAKLVIMNVPHPYVFFRHIQGNFRQTLRSWYMFFFQIPRLPEFLLGFNQASGLTQMMKRSSNEDTFSEGDLAQYRTAWLQPGAITGMLNWYRALFRNRSPKVARQYREKVTMPTLILWGKRDIALSAEMATESLEWCEAGDLIFFETATHWVQHDEPEAINTHLLKFLKLP